MNGDDTTSRIGRLEGVVAELTTAVAVHSERLKSIDQWKHGVNTQTITCRDDISRLKTNNAVMNARVVIYTGIVSGLFSGGMALLVMFLGKH